MCATLTLTAAAAGRGGEEPILCATEAGAGGPSGMCRRAFFCRILFCLSHPFLSVSSFLLPQVLQVMKGHGIGCEEATAALTVSAVLEASCRDRRTTLSRALADLTRLITTRTVLETGLVEAADAEEQDAGVRSLQPRSETSPRLVPPASSESVSPSRSFIGPGDGTPSSSRHHNSNSNHHYHNQQQQQQPCQPSAGTRRTRVRAVASHHTVSVKAPPPTPPHTPPSVTRARADSVDTQVHHKLDAASASTTGRGAPGAAAAATATLTPGTSMTTRAKRTRSEEAPTSTGAGTTTPSHKRSRTAPRA